MSYRNRALLSLISTLRRAAASSFIASPVVVKPAVGAAQPSARSRLLPWATLSTSLAAAGFMTVAHPSAAACAPSAGAAAGAPSSGGAVRAAPTTPFKVVFVLGGPGSGKGTQSARLVEEFGLAHLSAGDLLRAHMKSGSPEGDMVADMIKQGQIVPSHVTISLLQRAMEDSGKDKILIDGFPRNESNRADFETQTGIQPALVLFFDCPEEVMEKRLLGRNEGRTDDNIETIRKRFRVFIEQSMPVIEFYEKQGKVARINADRDPEDIYKEVRRLFLEL